MNGKEAPLGFVKEESCRISFFNEAAQLIRNRDSYTTDKQVDGISLL
jgi:hypothetical protein